MSEYSHIFFAWRCILNLEELNMNVGKEFSINIKKSVKDRIGYICQTDQGPKIIKKVYIHPKQILFQHDVKNHLYKNGFESIDLYAMSRKNLPYAEYGEHIYIMTDYIGGSTLCFQNKDQWIKIIESVAHAHKILKNVSLTSDPVIKKPNVIELCDKRIASLSSYKKRLSRQSNLTDFDCFFVKHYEYYMNLLVNTKSVLIDSNFDKLLEDAEKNNSVCHNILRAESFLPVGDDIYITNFIESSVAPRILDVAYLIKQYVKSFCNEEDISENYMSFHEIVKIYDSINPLSTEEQRVLPTLLLFPNKFSNICDEYYQKRRSFVPSALRIRIEKLIDRKDKIEQFLNPYAL